MKERADQLIYELPVGFSFYLRHQLFHYFSFIFCSRRCQLQIGEDGGDHSFDLFFIHHLWRKLFEDCDASPALGDDLSAVRRGHLQSLFRLLDLL